MKQSKLVIYFLACTIVIGLWFFHNRNKITFAQQVSLSGQHPNNIQCNVPKQTTRITSSSNHFTNTSNEQIKVTLKQNMDDQIEIAGQKFSVLFEAANVSTTMRKIIITDIELNFTYCTNVTVRLVVSKPKPPNQIYRLPVSHFLDGVPDPRSWFSDALYIFGCILLENDRYKVVIPESLSKAYEKAQKFKEEHTIMFEKLNAFLAQLRDKEFISKIEHGPKGIAKNFLLCETDPGQNYDYEREMVGFLKQAEIRKPSILDFVWTKQGKSNVIVCATVIKWSNGDISKYWPQFIYIDDQWKIFLPNLP